jgi:hypothetical protein
MATDRAASRFSLQTLDIRDEDIAEAAIPQRKVAGMYSGGQSRGDEHSRIESRQSSTTGAAAEHLDPSVSQSPQ